jgi:hypothetical protein
MIDLPDGIHNAPSPEVAAERLGVLLGLDAPAPLAATRLALEDRLFARALLATRMLPEVRDQLLATPGTAHIAGHPDIGGTQAPTSTHSPSSIQLTTKAASAVLKWGMDGLRHAKPWAIERRLRACNACDFQVEAPDTLVYRGAKVVVGKNAKICTQCHCLINTKAALATEHCPEQDPTDTTQSRWGEPWLAPEHHPTGPW